MDINSFFMSNVYTQMAYKMLIYMIKWLLVLKTYQTIYE